MFLNSSIGISEGLQKKEHHPQGGVWILNGMAHNYRSNNEHVHNLVET